MNDILRQTIYRMAHEARENEAQSKVASELEFDETFFAVDWGKYKRPALMLKEIVLLSVGINPAHRCARFDWIDKYESNTTGKAAAQIAEMLMRKKELVENLDVEGGEIGVAVLGNNIQEHRIKVADFVAFANSNGWELPFQLQTTDKAARETHRIRKDGRNTQKKENKIQAIERAAKELGYSDPLNLPIGARAAIKVHCIEWTEFRNSVSAFDRAWIAAGKEPIRVRLKNKEKYMLK